MSTGKKWVLGALLALGAGGTMIGACDSFAFSLPIVGGFMLATSVLILVAGVSAIEF